MGLEQIKDPETTTEWLARHKKLWDNQNAKWPPVESEKHWSDGYRQGFAKKPSD